MNPQAMAFAQESARLLAEADPIAACKAMLAGLRQQTPGCHEVVLRYLTQEIKFMNPPLRSSASASGAVGAALSPAAAGPALSDPVCLPPTGSPAALTALPAGSDRPAAGRTFRGRRR